MSGQRYTPEFKDEADRQVIERGYSVGEVAQCDAETEEWDSLGAPCPKCKKPHRSKAS